MNGRKTPDYFGIRSPSPPPPPLRVTAVARKRPRPFCQKCKWQVLPQYHVKDPGHSAKSASGRLKLNTRKQLTKPMWLCMKRHGAWLHGVHRTRRDGSSFMWHQPCQRCKYTTSVIFHKTLYKAIHSCRITCEHSEPARERRIALYKSDQQQLTSLCFVFSVRTAFNPFTAAACEISGLKDAGTCLQTVCFPVL